MPRRPARFTQADIARALRAVAQVGVKAAVKLAPDGSILIIPDDSHGANPQIVKELIADPGESVLW